EPRELQAQIAAQEALLEADDAASAARGALQALATAVPFEWGAVLRFQGEAVEVTATYPSAMAGVPRGTSWTPPSTDEALVRDSGKPSMDGNLAERESASPLERLPAFGLQSRLLIPLFA